MTPTAAPVDRTEVTRRRALDAARESVLRLGLTRTSMVEIAKRSGVGRTTLYRYWPDISSLLGEVLTEELVRVLDGTDTEARTGEDVARMICAIADELRRSPVLDALRTHEPELLSRYVFRRLGTAQQYLVAQLADRLTTAARTDDRLVGRDPTVVATMTILAAQGAVLSAEIADPPLDPETWNAELHTLVTGYLGL